MPGETFAHQDVHKDIAFKKKKKTTKWETNQHLSGELWVLVLFPTSWVMLDSYLTLMSLNSLTSKMKTRLAPNS